MLGWGIGPSTMVKCHSHREQTGRNSQAWFPNPGLSILNQLTSWLYSKKTEKL